MVTGGRPGGGTSAGVYVVLCGKEGGVAERVWLDSRQMTLQPGQTDTFEVGVSRLVSPVQALVVGHDNTGISPGWFLEEVSTGVRGRDRGCGRGRVTVSRS